MFLALRELRRARLRFALLAASVGLLVFLVLFQTALRDGLVTQFIGALRNQSAPILVYDDQARRNLEGSQLPLAAVEEIAGVEGIARTGPIGEGTFTVSTPVSREEAEQRDRLVDAVLFGYRIDAPDGGGLGAPTTLVEGRLPGGPDEGVASSRNTGEGFGLGDVVRVEPGGPEIVIVGLADDINFSVAPTVFVAYETWEKAVRARNPDAIEVLPSVVAAEPESGTDPATAAASIGAAVAGVDALTRQQAEDESPGVANVRSSLSTVIGLLQFTVVLVVGLFLLILTTQKAGPLTLLRAMGASTTMLVRSLLVQAAVIVSGGIVIGIALLVALLPAFQDVVGSVDAVAAAGACGAIALAALVGSVFAVLRIVRIDPAQATQPVGGLR